MKKHTLFTFCLLTFSCLYFCSSCKDNTALEEFKATKEKLAAAEKALAAATPKEELNFIHSVFFWMKEDFTAQQNSDFEKDLQALDEISSIGKLYWGTAAGTDLAVVDNSYDYALIVHFKDAKAQDAYQVDKIHADFVEKHKDSFTKVVVYDSIVK